MYSSLINVEGAVMDIQYKLTVTVDDKVVFESDYPDTTMLEEELGKAEFAVEAQLAVEAELADE